MPKYTRNRLCGDVYEVTESVSALASEAASSEFRAGAESVRRREGPPVTRTLRGLRTYHIESGNQNFYSLVSGANRSEAETQRRLALLDQLRAMTSNPAAAAALQAARDFLSVRIAAN